MSVAKYAAKFIELARFTPYIVDIDYKKAQKFEGGLDLEVFDRVGVLKLPTYVEVLNSDGKGHNSSQYTNYNSNN